MYRAGNGNGYRAVAVRHAAVAFALTIIGGKVAAIEMIADAEPIGQLEVVLA